MVSELLICQISLLCISAMNKLQQIYLLIGTTMIHVSVCVSLDPQMQPPEVFCKKKLFLKISQYSHRKRPVLGSFFIKVTGLNACNFIKKRLRHRYFLVNIAKYLRTPNLKKILERLLLDLSKFHHWNSRAKRSNHLRCFVFLEILQNSQENICAKVSFLIKLQPSALLLY